MYPTVSDMLKDLLGFDLPLPIQTFGFFVAIAFLLGSWLLARELKRKQDEGRLRSSTRKVLIGEKASPTELLLQGILGFLIGFKLVWIVLNYAAFTDDPQSGILSAKGNLVGGLLGAGLLIWLRYREKEKNRLKEPVWKEEKMRAEDHVGSMTILAAVFGLLGAKIFHNLEYWETFVANPWEELFSFSGLTMYGGLIAGGAAVLWYARKHQLGLRHVMDASAPALMLAYGVGRLGCQFAGDGDWGIVNTEPVPGALSFLPDWFWSYNYPNNVINEGVPIPGCEGKHCMVLPEPVYPTPLYESIASIALFGVLWAIRKRVGVPGVLFSIYLIFNGVERFFVEKIRVNATYSLFGMEVTQAEIISVLLVIAGIFGIFYFRKRYVREKLKTVPDEA